MDLKDLFTQTNKHKQKLHTLDVYWQTGEYSEDIYTSFDFILFQHFTTWSDLIYFWFLNWFWFSSGFFGPLVLWGEPAHVSTSLEQNHKIKDVSSTEALNKQHESTVEGKPPITPSNFCSVTNDVCFYPQKTQSQQESVIKKLQDSALSF